jgi:hypothetical protein
MKNGRVWAMILDVARWIQLWSVQYVVEIRVRSGKMPRGSMGYKKAAMLCYLDVLDVFSLLELHSLLEMCLAWLIESFSK